MNLGPTIEYIEKYHSDLEWLVRQDRKTDGYFANITNRDCELTFPAYGSTPLEALQKSLDALEKGINNGIPKH